MIKRTMTMLLGILLGLSVGALADTVIYVPFVGHNVNYELSFTVTTDQRDYTGPDQFAGVVEAIAEVRLRGDLMISAGDVDPPWTIAHIVTTTLGLDHQWLPVVGNHEVRGSNCPGNEACMPWLRHHNLNTIFVPGLVSNGGPESCPLTTYSFDREPVHFVILDQFCGDYSETSTASVTGELYDWLAADLAGTEQEYIFVFGHYPVFRCPDAEWGPCDVHHSEMPEGLRFWELMANNDVTAYVCGHSHLYSLIQRDGVYQIDAGHARGYDPWSGARSTFLVVRVYRRNVEVEVWRDDFTGWHYQLMDTESLQ